MKLNIILPLLLFLLPALTWGDDVTLFPYDTTKTLFGEKAIAVNKPLFIDFWASWCSPCKESFVEYNRLEKEFSGKIQFVAVNEDSDKSEAEKFLKSNTLNLNVLYDKDRTFARKLKVMALPTLFIFDSKGQLKLMVRGFDQKRMKEIHSTLKEIQ